MEIHISNWTHKFQNKTGLDAKANSELCKSKRVCSVYCTYVLMRPGGSRDTIQIYGQQAIVLSKNENFW